MCVWCVSPHQLQPVFCWLQLQEALLQREAELLRLQEENNKLRRFLSSAFIRSLEPKVWESGGGGGGALQTSTSA